MVFVVDAVEYDIESLDLAELEKIETITGRGFAQVDPLARVMDFVAVASVLLARTHDSAAVKARLDLVTLGDLRAMFRP